MDPVYLTTVMLCTVRLADIDVGLEPDDFVDGGALKCARNFTLGATKDAYVRCTQRVVGQYVTIRNLVYHEYEGLTFAYDKCFSFCEVQVYVAGEFPSRTYADYKSAVKVAPSKTFEGRQFSQTCLGFTEC